MLFNLKVKKFIKYDSSSKSAPFKDGKFSLNNLTLLPISNLIWARLKKTDYKINKTGLQPVSRPVNKFLGFIQKV